MTLLSVRSEELTCDQWNRPTTPRTRTHAHAHTVVGKRERDPLTVSPQWMRTRRVWKGNQNEAISQVTFFVIRLTAKYIYVTDN